MNEPFYRLMVLGLLAGILFVQVANHERPLTLAAYKAATAEQRKELMNKIPWVRVTGGVNVENSVSVNVENGLEPVQVKVVPP